MAREKRVKPVKETKVVELVSLESLTVSSFTFAATTTLMKAVSLTGVIDTTPRSRYSHGCADNCRSDVRST